jgi:hypothetical protein
MAKLEARMEHGRADVAVVRSPKKKGVRRKK